MLCVLPLTFNVTTFFRVFHHTFVSTVTLGSQLPYTGETPQRHVPNTDVTYTALQQSQSPCHIFEAFLKILVFFSNHIDCRNLQVFSPSDESTDSVKVGWKICASFINQRSTATYTYFLYSTLYYGGDCRSVSNDARSVSVERGRDVS